MVEYTLDMSVDAWARSAWKEENCTIEPTTDGRYAIVDHNIQMTVAVANTHKEALYWLIHNG